MTRTRKIPPQAYTWAVLAAIGLAVWSVAIYATIMAVTE